jgi:3D (Asp-Asp-Asp) domain-containing protein
MKKISLITLFITFLFSLSSNTTTEKIEHKDYTLKGIVRKATITCYQPVKEQCNTQPLITADGSHINLNKLRNGKIKWCAVSRNLEKYFPKGKPKRMFIEGFGIYEVKDRMNKRWTDRVDILIHPSDKTRFKLDNIKIVILQ